MTSDRTALVTGASGAIGRAIAKRFLENGWTVHGTYKDNKEKVPDGCESIQLPLDDPEKIPDHLTSVFQGPTFESLNILIHCAGNVRNKSILNMTPSDWQTIRSVHLDASFQLARTTRPHFDVSEEKPAHLVFIGSRVGLRGGYGQGNYASAKSGLVGFTHSLAREWGPKINVNLIRPPLTRSDMTDSIPDYRMAEVTEPSLSGEPASPERTARLVTYLVSEPKVTGQILSCDDRIHGPWS